MTQKHFFAIATALSVASSFSQPSVAQTAVPLPPPGRAEVCRQVLSMPGASNTDELLTLLRTNRVDLLNNLRAMKGNMERYNAEGIGWQNAIDVSSALQPRPGSWMIGALRIACESPTGVSSAKVTGSVRYRQRDRAVAVWQRRIFSPA